MHHRRGQDRDQITLLPESLEDFVEQDSIVRVIDAWVRFLDMKELGFRNAEVKERGAPPYDPADLLALYLWGYLNATRSSRRLEKEARRNTECMWLLRRLTPDHKTIAEFRRQNPQALHAMCTCFVEFANDQGLLGRIVAIDGTKVRSVASRKSVLGKKKLAERAKKNAEQVARYMAMLEENDRAEDGQDVDSQQVRATLQRLQAEGVQIEQQLRVLQDAGAETLVQTEAEAQVMKSLQGAPGYNVQSAVDAQSGLIVHHDVVRDANDSQQLQPMAEGAAAALGAPCTAVSDAGYSNGSQMAALQAKQITCYVAPKRGVNNRGLMDRGEFRYEAEADQYVCPQGKILSRKHVLAATQQVVYRAKASDCGKCPIRDGCTNAEQRSVTRHVHEDALQANAERVRENPHMMKLRRCVAELPFDDLKHRIMGNARLLMRGLLGAGCEMSIAVMVHNLKKVTSTKGTHWITAALQG